MFRNPTRARQALLTAYENRELVSGRINGCAVGVLIREFVGANVPEWYTNPSVLNYCAKAIGCSGIDLIRLEAAFEGREADGSRNPRLTPDERLSAALGTITGCRVAVC